jgi:hypothetical protein
VNRVERESGELNQVYMTIEAAVEAEITQVRGHPLKIRRVVTNNRDRNASLLVGGGQPLDGVRDIEGELIVAAFVGANQGGSHPELGRLPGSLKVEDGSAIGKGVVDGDVRAVPPLATEIGLVRIACVVVVEAVRERGGLPQTVVLRVPDFGDATDSALTK